MNGTIRYTIRPYDTIWMLAQVFNTTVDDIMNLNPGIDPRNLMVGQVVSLRPGFQYYPSYSETSEDGEDTGADSGAGTGAGTGGYTGSSTGAGIGGDTGSSTGAGTGGYTGSSIGGYTGAESDDMNMDLEDLVNYFRILWEEHETWTMMTVLGIVHDLPETDIIVKRLLRNPVDFANALAPFYGEEAARQFADLFTAHLTIASDIVKAAKAGDNNTVTETDKKWRENAEQIAALLAQINPYWNEEDWSAMLNEHLDLLSNFVTNMIAENYEEAIMGFDDMEAQALEMADMMAYGISEQFPG